MERLLCYMSSAHMHCREDWIACLDHANDGFDGVELFSEETASTSPICLKRGAWRSRGTRIAGIESRPTHGYSGIVCRTMSWKGDSAN